MGKIVEIKDLSFTYPGGTEKALDRVRLDIDDGEFLVLCGKSGSGKSTLLSQLKPAIAPHGSRSGEILYRGCPLGSMDDLQQARQIGFVMQDPESQIVTDKVWHELAFGPESLGLNNRDIRLRVAEMAAYFGINEWFYRDVRELSGGQKQLLNLASVMVMHPRLLILDEPTSQLDPVAASSFLATVGRINRDLGTTVILTEHRLEEVFTFADRAAVMENGRMLYTGTPSGMGEYLRSHENDMFAAMPVPMQIYSHTDSSLECPVTVRDGRKWLAEICGGTDAGKKNDVNKAGGETDAGKYKDVSKAGGEADAGKYKDVSKAGGEADAGKYKDVSKAVSETDTGEENDVSKAVSGMMSPDDNESERDILLSCRGLWFRYDRDLPDVIRGLDLSLKRGEFYCLLGGNGSGKSTLLSILCRINKPYRGKISLGGRKLESYSDRELYREFLGVLPQDPRALFAGKTVIDELYEMTGGRSERKNADYHIAMDKSEAVEGIAHLTHLERYLDRHPYDLSGGEQQRLALAKILLLRPKLILMDEPTKGMDGCFKQEFAEMISRLRDQGVTIFMISHDIEFAAMYADRCGLLFDGKISSSGTSHEFFAGNSFYTTAANRMARDFFPEAVTCKDVVECLKKVNTVKIS